MSTFSLAGSGTHALSAGVGQLHVHVTTLPSTVGQGHANPTNYYHVGSIRAGDGTSWWNPQPIEAIDAWLGLPTGTTEIGYSLLDGATIDVTEVLLDNPFRGSPGATGATGATGPAGPSGSTPLGYVIAQLPANVSITPADTFIDGPSVVLSTGTWLLIGSVLYDDQGNVLQATAKLWDGSTVAASLQQRTFGSANNPYFLTLVGIAIVAAGTPTWKISVAGAGGAPARLLAAALVHGAGNNASTLVAVQIA